MVELNNAEYNALAISAFRYALGRMTYIVHDHVETFLNHIDDLNMETRFLMIREIDVAEETHNLGMDMDALKWNDLRYKLWESLDDGTRNQVNLNRQGQGDF